jgi:hypothetical protein
MKRIKYTYSLCWLISVLFATLGVNAQVSFETKQFRLSLTKSGQLSELTRITNNKNYLPAAEQSCLLRIKLQGKELSPSSIEWRKKTSELLLVYPASNAVATVKVKQQPGYISFTLQQLTVAKEVEWVQWGPFPTNIADTIGEVVGVVRDKDFAYWHPGVEY